MRRAFFSIFLLAAGCIQAADAAPCLVAGIPRGCVVQKLAGTGSGGDSSPTAAFDAAFDEQDMGVSDGSCADADASEQWDFAEASGNLSGECNTTTLTAVGSGHTYSVTGINGTGSAITFDGASSFSAGDNLDIGTSDFVVQGVIQLPSNSAGADYYVGKWDTTDDGFLFYGSGAAIRLVMEESNVSTDQAFCGSNTLRDDTWHHVRWEIDRDAANGGDCYIDGVLVAQTSWTARTADITSTEPFCVGGGLSGCTSTQMEGSWADLQFHIGTISDLDDTWDDGLTEANGATPTFVRATQDTRLDRTISEGQLVWTGNAALGAPVDTDGSVPETADAVGVFIGGSSTTVLLHNEDLTNAAWSGGIGVADTEPDPFGGVRADYAEDNNAGVAETLHQDVTVSDDSTTWTIGWWEKCDSAHAVEVWLQLRDGTQVTTKDEHTCSTTWEWRTASATNNSTGNTTARFLICPADCDTASATGTLHVYRPQMINRAGFPGSRMPATTSSSVTINADILSYGTLADIGYSGGDITLCAWVYQTDDVATSPYIFHSGTAATVTLGLDTSGAIYLAATDTHTFTLDAANDAWNFVCGAVDDGVAGHGYLNGTLESDASATWAGANTAGTIYVGSNSGTNPFEGFIAGATIYDSLLTEAELDTIYAAGIPTAFLHPQGLDRDVMLAARARVTSPDFPQPVFSLNPKAPLEEVLR